MHNDYKSHQILFHLKLIFRNKFYNFHILDYSDMLGNASQQANRNHKNTLGKGLFEIPQQQ